MADLIDIPLHHVRDIHAIAEALIERVDEEMAARGITEGNVAIDAVINCLCYAMKHSPPELDGEELLRRVKKYSLAMDLSGAPGNRDEGDRS